jgi:hypothetical protein
MVPYLALASQCFANISRITPLLTYYEEYSTYQCYLDGLLFYLSVQMSIVLMPIMFIHNILVINMNINKQHVYTNKKNKKKRTSLYLKAIMVIKWLINPSIQLSLYIIVYLVNIVVTFLIISLNSDLTQGIQCLTLSIKAYGYYFHVFNVVIGLITVTLTLFDIILNLKKIFSFKFLYHYFWKDDPRLFRFHIFNPRIEFFNFLFSSLLYILLGIAYLYILDLIDPGLIIETAKMFITEILLFVLLYYQVLFPLFITIIFFIYEKIKSKIFKTIDDKDNKHELESLLNSKEKIFNDFENFVNSEYSTSNLMIYMDIQEFNQLEDFQERKSLAFEIQKEYLNGSLSPNEINIDGTSLNSIKSKLSENNNQILYENIMSQRLFFEVESVVKINLMDTFFRFKRSLPYQNHINQKKNINLKKQFLEKNYILDDIN